MHSKKLNLKYQILPDKSVSFEDGVVYLRSECMALGKDGENSPETIKGIHMIRKVFKGPLERLCAMTEIHDVKNFTYKNKKTRGKR